jgi:hypothetical protein
MSTRSSSRPPLIIVIIMVMVGSALAWQVVTKTLTAYLADAAPDWALVLEPGNKEAALNLAEEKLGLTQDGKYITPDENAPRSVRAWAKSDEITAKGILVPMVAPDISEATRAEVEKLAKTALVNDPLDARALRIMGQISTSEAKTTQFMEKSVLRSKHEILALYWLLQKSFLDADYAKTTHYIDILLRSHPQLYSYIIPILGRIAESKDGKAPVEALIESNPPWRWLFIETFIRSVTDARTAMTLFLDMRTKGAPPTPKEIQLYLNFLIEYKLYDLAYYTWVQLLPSEEVSHLGLLYNSNFALPISGAPFDWTIRNGAGTRIDIVDHPDNPNNRALYFEFIDGRVGTTTGVSQIVTLVPGQYRLKWMEKGSIRARRGLRWSVTCLEKQGNLLAESDAFVGDLLEWHQEAFDFQIPATNCHAQQLLLSLDARTDSERIVTGSAWFADINLAGKPN